MKLPFSFALARRSRCQGGFGANGAPPLQKSRLCLGNVLLFPRATPFPRREIFSPRAELWGCSAGRWTALPAERCLFCPPPRLSAVPFVASPPPRQPPASSLLLRSGRAAPPSFASPFFAVALSPPPAFRRFPAVPAPPLKPCAPLPPSAGGAHTNPRKKAGCQRHPAFYKSRIFRDSSIVESRAWSPLTRMTYG